MANATLHELAQTIEGRWKQRSFSEASFCEIAVRALEEAALERELTPKALLEAALDEETIEDRLPEHGSARVVGLFNSSRFSFFGHFWSSELGVLHHHRWNGAFHVIAGESVEARYEFREKFRVRRSFGFGELSRTSLAHRKPGNTVPVSGGTNTIHGIAHIDPLCVSVSVRAEDSAQVEMAYLRPGLTHRHVNHPAAARHCNKVLKLLAQADPDATETCLEKLVETTELETAFYLLRGVFDRTGDGRLVQRLCEAGRRRHGDAILAIEQALEDLASARMIERSREVLKRRTPRLLLAALYLGENRSDVDRVLQTAGASIAVSDVDKWSAELFASEHPAFGIRFDSIQLRAFEELLRDHRPRELTPVHQAIRKIPMLRPLFRTQSESDEASARWSAILDAARAQLGG